jgi:hypothetical protein
MPDTDQIARRAYDVFYAALGAPHQPWGWAHLRPVVQEAWRAVVRALREDKPEEEDEHA